MKDLTFSRSTEKFFSVSVFFSSGLEAEAEGRQGVLKGRGKVSKEIVTGVALLLAVLDSLILLFKMRISTSLQCREHMHLFLPLSLWI